MPDSSIGLVLSVSKETKNQYDSLFYGDSEYRLYEQHRTEYPISSHLSSLIYRTNLSINRTYEELRTAATNVATVDIQFWKMLKEGGAYKEADVEYDKVGSYLEPMNLPLTRVRFNKLEDILPIVSLQQR